MAVFDDTLVSSILFPTLFDGSMHKGMRLDTPGIGSVIDNAVVVEAAAAIDQRMSRLFALTEMSGSLLQSLLDPVISSGEAGSWDARFSMRASAMKHAMMFRSDLAIWPLGCYAE